jgi:hypothetical protein
VVKAELRHAAQVSVSDLSPEKHGGPERVEVRAGHGVTGYLILYEEHPGMWQVEQLDRRLMARSHDQL